ncbi:hypothetical protein CFIMG_007593RA00001 [Ceratocystis fimbriata CBS 114723]|uniref:Uncharacterized protein n=1 Tax=Ceratocystis fimbriata CBS 114723 TaxID=1035309 RepID=A0A2C5W724_9PEZI|nr:hypothetical protein CFIMG_007593RA00001 [Ceratocystis fimbriata CBS 114723]
MSGGGVCVPEPLMPIVKRCINPKSLPNHEPIHLRHMLTETMTVSVTFATSFVIRGANVNAYRPPLISSA